MKLKIIEMQRSAIRPKLSVYKHFTAKLNKAGVEEMDLKHVDYISAGTLDGVLYLIASDKNNKNACRVRHTMTEGLTLNNREWNKAIGLQEKTKYDIDKITDEDGVFYKLTLIVT